jgi:hypothetical protein
MESTVTAYKDTIHQAASEAIQRALDRRQQALDKLNPATIPAVQAGDRVLIAPGCGHSAVGAIVMAGPSADGYFQARYAGTAPLCLDHGQNAWLQPGDARNVAWGDGLVALVIGEVHGPHGNAIPDGRAISPAPAVIVQTVERVVTIQPSQPKPASTEATARRSRAGNTIRKQTGRGTWAAINLGADGQRFQRQQLTTKLHPQARAALEQLAADAGLRVCEVLEALVLAPGAAAVVGRARPLGVRPAGAEPLATAADRTGERRTRLTKGQAERVDQVLLELLERGRTGKADLERVAAAIAADGLPAQGVSTLRTRLTRLARRQGQGQ